MEQTEIIEGNKIIAVFMGLEWSEPYERWYLNCNPALNEGKAWLQQHKKLKYHSSWEWLMPVIDKIEAVGEFDVDLENNYHFFIGKRYTRVVYDWNFYSTASSTVNDMNAKEHLEKMKLASKDYRHSVFDGDKRYSTWTAVVDFIKWHNEKSK